MGIYIGGSTPQNGPIPQFRPDPWEGLRQVTVDPWDQMRQATPQQAAVPGLLSRLTSPDNRDAMLGLAAGLLDAGRWSTTPVSWGEALGAGVKGYAAGKLTAEQRKQIEREQKRRDDEAAREAKRLEAYQQLVSGGVEGLTDTQRALLASMTPEQGAQMLMAQTMRQGAAENPNYINIEVSPGGRIVTLDSNDPAQNAEARKLFAAGGKQVGLGAGRDSSKEEAIARLTSQGVDKTTAVGIVDGRLQVSRDDTGRAIILDVATGKPWQGPYPDNRPAGGVMPLAPSGPPQVDPLQPTAPTGAPTAPRPPVPPAAAGRTPGLPTPSIDPNVNPSAATGVGGTVSNYVNSITDWLGGRAYDPKNMEATTALDSLATRTRVMLQDAVPGKPTNYALELMDPYIVDANEIGSGPEKAMSKFKQTAKVLTTERERLKNEVLDHPEKWTPEDVRQAQRGYDNMGALLADYELILSKFPGSGSGPAGGRPSLDSFDR